MKNVKLIIKRIFPILLTAAILLPLFPATCVKGETSGTQLSESVYELGRELMENMDKDPYAFRSRDRRLLSSGPLPSSYDLRDVDTDGDGIGDTSYVTPVKFQNPFGTCWGFAAVSAAETSLLSSGLADSNIDLSEKHTAFFAYRPINDANNSQYGEGMIFAGETGSSAIYDHAGTSFYATGLYASGAGPVLESDNEDFKYHGKEKKIQYRDGVEYCYDPDDDWWLDDALRFRQDYALKESHILPNPPIYLKEGNQSDFDRAITAMKGEIRERRSLYISYTSPNASPGSPIKPDYINQDTWAHYTYDPDVGSNHAVAIIGYDDNYPKENFVHEVEGGGSSPEPQNNGAWLVKNSWGSEEEGFPNKGLGNWGLLKGQDKGVYNEESGKWEYNTEEDAPHTGYFWLSYEDLSISKIESFEFEPTVNNDLCTAQYDYMPVENVNAAFVDYKISTANVFKLDEVTGGEAALIDHVSCQTTAPGTEVHYEVYRLRDGYENPCDGNLVADMIAEYPYGGFHKEALERPVLIPDEGAFSVVVTQKAPDNTYSYDLHYALNKHYYDEYPEFGEYNCVIINRVINYNIFIF